MCLKKKVKCPLFLAMLVNNLMEQQNDKIDNHMNKILCYNNNKHNISYLPTFYIFLKKENEKKGAEC